MQVFKAVIQFLDHLKLMKGVSLHTLRGYSTDLTSFFTFISEEKKDLPLSSVSKRAVRKYLAHLYDSKKSTRTVLRRLSALRSFYNHAMKEKWILENPTEEIESPKKEKKLPLSITYAQ